MHRVSHSCVFRMDEQLPNRVDRCTLVYLVHLHMAEHSHKLLFEMLQVIEHYFPTPSKILLQCDEGSPG